MARLLRDTDYLKSIQTDNLNQIIEASSQIKLDMEQAAQSEMIGYLSQRYLVDKIFTNTTTFSISATYYGKNLVEYTEATFSATTVYTINQRVVYNGNIYKSIAGSAAHAFAPAEWTLVCADKLLFYAKLNATEYSASTTYAVGNTVWYNDVVYTCTTACKNILPTTAGFWTAGATYSFTAAYPDDTTKWTQGDNRNQLIVLYLVDITLYHLHARIQPNNVPELRKIRYDGNGDLEKAHSAIRWLRECGNGHINADLPNIDPQQGMSIRWGNVNGLTERITNSY
jgi:hypothetical protein